MGKKAKLKKIRKIAAQMPRVMVGHVQGERVSGAELFKSGVEEVEGSPVDVDATYKKKNVVAVPLNHNRKMKQMYNKQGVKGVSAYIQAVNRYMMAQKLAEKAKQKEQEKLEGVMSDGAHENDYCAEPVLETKGEVLLKEQGGDKF
jgi:hypothetical protein